MARLVKQFRYYGDGDANSVLNYPDNVTYAALATGNIFQKTPAITQLGIQADPDLRFYVNNSVDPIYVGATGIYEIDLEGLGTISSIRIDRDSLRNIDYATKRNSLMIDIIYEGASS